MNTDELITNCMQSFVYPDLLLFTIWLPQLYNSEGDAENKNEVLFDVVNRSKRHNFVSTFFQTTK
jgi:hypothetical protein